MKVGRSVGLRLHRQRTSYKLYLTSSRFTSYKLYLTSYRLTRYNFKITSHDLILASVGKDAENAADANRDWNR